MDIVAGRESRCLLQEQVVVAALGVVFAQSGNIEQRGVYAEILDWRRLSCRG